jgi:hypothetical protein
LTGVADAYDALFLLPKNTSAFPGASLMQLLLASYALTELTCLPSLQVKWLWRSWLVNSKPAGELQPSKMMSVCIA